MEVKNQVTLTDHQVDKLEDIVNRLAKGKKRIVLMGSAGVGKTTLVNFLMSSYSGHLGSQLIYVSAPTHKALSVLKTKINMEEDQDPIIFCTIHKGLKLKMITNNRTGVKTWVQKYPRNSPPFHKCGLLIVDEASMLNQKMLDWLEDYQFPIIFIGDNKQINPVKEVNSPVFEQHWYTVELTEIVRQAEGNPIIDLSRNLPLIQGKIEDTHGEVEDRSGYLFSSDRNKIIYKLAQINGTDELKYIAWTNKEVDSINYSVRATIYGDNPAMIEVGEVLVLNAQYVIDRENILYNNYELEVETLEVITETFHCENKSFEYKVYLINEEIYAIHEEYIQEHKQNVRAVKAMAINKHIGWKEYFAFSEQFLDFKYNHAITVHKSQGSTYKDVIINIGDIMLNRKVDERTRLLYTGVTRASNLVVLYNV
jgi:exodeoxyribonuclease-5